MNLLLLPHSIQQDYKNKIYNHIEISPMSLDLVREIMNFLEKDVCPYPNPHFSMTTSDMENNYGIHLMVLKSVMDDTNES